MHRVVTILAFSTLALPSYAQEAIEGLPAGTLVFDAAPVTQSPASTRSPAQPVEAGTVLDPVAAAPLIDLAPGEEVLQVIAVPAIVKIPDPQPAYVIESRNVPEVRVVPEPVVDPVSGRLRDTPGWTGRTEGPASIGCFPAGSCAVLNQR